MLFQHGEKLTDLPVCGAIARADGLVCFRVWAPYAKSVDLVLFAAGSAQKHRTVAMKPEPRAHFVHTEAGIAEGQRYAFRLDQGPERPDPASRWQPEGVHRPSAVIDLDRFLWSEGDWTGLPRNELIIYELHVGTFTQEGTFDAVIGRLDELRALGITAIELMPVAQFPGERDWGYDSVHPYAVQNSYGGPRGLQRLVNACHRAGLAVILDVIYNHLGPEGNYCADFGPYFSDRYHTPWGSAMNFDNRGSDPVRAFVTENVRFWIRAYHVDGLRLDAVHAIYDFSARHILRDVKEAADEEARRLGRTVHVIAESDLNDVRLLDPPESGGDGLDAQWSDDFHHAVHALLTGERTNYYLDFGKPEQLVKALNQQFVYDGLYSRFRDRRHGGPAGSHPSERFVIAIQNHDQVGNRPRGDRLSTLVEPAQLRLAAGVLLLAPQIPLIFMGEEYGETRPFPFFCSFQDPQIVEATRRGRRQEFSMIGMEGEIPDPQSESTFASARLSWSWPDGSPNAALRRLYCDLLTIRRNWLPPGDPPIRYAYSLESRGDSVPVLLLVRQTGAHDPAPQRVACFNLGAQPVALPEPLSTKTGSPLGSAVICSEAVRFGGRRRPDEPLDVLLPFEFWIFESALRKET